MSGQKKGITKNEIAYIIAIVLGLVIGVLIKRIRVGLMIGLVLCVLIGLSTIMRFMRNK